MVRLLEGAAHAMGPGAGAYACEAAVSPTWQGRPGALRQGRLRHRVRIPLRLAGVRGDPQPDRFRSVAAPAGVQQEARVRRYGDERALRSLYHRDVGGADRTTL